jgi:hypothetical protein
VFGENAREKALAFADTVARSRTRNPIDQARVVRFEGRHEIERVRVEGELRHRAVPNVYAAFGDAGGVDRARGRYAAKGIVDAKHLPMRRATRAIICNAEPSALKQRAARSSRTLKCANDPWTGYVR